MTIIAALFLTAFVAYWFPMLQLAWSGEFPRSPYALPAMVTMQLTGGVLAVGALFA
jgi:hypothetical protein